MLLGRKHSTRTHVPANAFPPPHPASVVPEGPRGGSDWLEDLGGEEQFVGKAILTYSGDRIQK